LRAKNQDDPETPRTPSTVAKGAKLLDERSRRAGLPARLRVLPKTRRATIFAVPDPRVFVYVVLGPRLSKRVAVGILFGVFTAAAQSSTRIAYALGKQPLAPR